MKKIGAGEVKSDVFLLGGGEGKHKKRREGYFWGGFLLWVGLGTLKNLSLGGGEQFQ